LSNQERDPVAVAFERAVRHDAVVNRIKAIYRRSALKGSARTWRAIRALLRHEGRK
jgi:hypothetical protein